MASGSCSLADPDLRSPAHRTARVELKVTIEGRPFPLQEVLIEQTRHQFWFGNGWADSSLDLANGKLSGAAREHAERREELFSSLFDAVTLPFYWSRFEPQRGETKREMLLNAAQSYRARGVRLKGHPLCWHTLCPAWLLELDNDAIRKALLGRTRRELTDFAGLVESWDVVNEPVIMPTFAKYDNAVTRLCRERPVLELIAALFATARNSEPSASLVLNDFETSEQYACLIESCLEHGIRIDAIGIQSHMHQGYWGVERTQRVLERFSRFGLPLQFTENSLVSGKLMPQGVVDLNDYRLPDWPSTSEGEERQAAEVVQHYRTLFDHPLVSSITWWELVDGGWLSAPSGLVRKDLSPKPAYDELRKLIREEWWTLPTRSSTDQDGSLAFVGVLGDYRLSCAGRTGTFTLSSAIQTSSSQDATTMVSNPATIRVEL